MYLTSKLQDTLGLTQENYTGLNLYILPILLSAYLGGQNAGFVATATAGLMAGPLLMDGVLHDMIRWSSLVISGGVISLLLQNLHTTRQKAEKALQDVQIQQQQLLKITQSVPGALCSWKFLDDGSSQILYASPNIQEILGIELAELQHNTDPIYRHIHPEDLPAFLENGRLSSQKRKPFHAIYRYQHAHKGERWIESWAAPYHESESDLIWYTYTHDITESKQAELKFHESEARFRLYIEHVPLAIFVFNNAMECIDVNPAALAMLQCDMETLQKLQFLSFIDAASLEQAQQHLKDFIASGTLEGEYQLQRPDGGCSWVFFKGIRIASDRLMAYGQDITTLKNNQQELTSYRQHLESLVLDRTQELEDARSLAQLILEASADGLYGIDVDGHCNFINPALCTLLGYEVDELLGQNIHTSVHHTRPDGQPYPEEECPIHQTILHGASAHVVDDVFWTKQHTPVAVAWSSRPLHREGKIVGSVISVTDIRHHKAAELARDQALREAERLAQVRSEFLANMSHEIRTPLNAVLGLAQIGLRENHGTKQQKLFEQIQESGSILSAVVNDILDFSKIDAGKLILEHETFLLGDVIDQVIRQVQGRAYVRQLDFQLEEAPDLPLKCVGDPLRLSQILLNLLSNAIKFTERGWVRLSVLCSSEGLRFEVSDTGIGITEDQLPHLFQPFEQADRSTTRRFGGTGLGLSICMRLVALMGGSIKVQSHVGQGSRFSVLLPHRMITEIASPSPALNIGMLGIRPEEYRQIQQCLPSVMSLSPFAISSNITFGAILADPSQVAPAILERLQAQHPPLILLLRPNQLIDPLLSKQRSIESPFRLRHFLQALHTAPTPVADAPLPRLKGLKILAAEDNELNRLVLMELLEQEEAIIQCVENGKLAVERIQAEGPTAYDVVLTDIQMPIMDGYEATQRIRSLAPALPIIGLTAHAMPEERQRCLEVGMVEHITKPIDIEKLVTILLNFTKKPEPLEPQIDWEALKARYKGRPGFLDRLLAAIRQSNTGVPQQLMQAADENNTQQLLYLSHSMKGMAGNLMAHTIRELASQAEAAARQNQPNAPELGRALAHAIERLIASLPTSTSS